MPALTPEQTSHLLNWIVRRHVRDCVDDDRLDGFKLDLAIEVGRMPGVTDQAMLALSRGLIGRAFRDIGDRVEHPDAGSPDEEDRYWNAICFEVLPESERNRHATVSR
jgi:hypothetical protein